MNKENNLSVIFNNDDELVKTFNSAIDFAIEENKKFGIPSVFSIEGTMVFQMPDGTIKTEKELIKDSI